MQAAKIISRSSRLLATRSLPSCTSNRSVSQVCTRISLWHVPSKSYGTPGDPRYASLYSAIERGDKTVVRAELEKGGVNVNGIDDEHGKTPLAAAVLAGNVDIVKMLIVNGADINAWTQKDGNTLLHIATKNGNEQIALLLIQYGIKLNTLNKANATPLLIAVTNGRTGILKALLKEGVKVTAVGESEYPLNAAARTGQVILARELVAHEATFKDATAHLTDNMTPIHLAAENGHSATIKYLATVQHAVLHAERASDGATPLHLAAANGHLEAVRVLCDMNASVTKEDKKGRTAAALAREKGHKHVAEFLAGLPKATNNHK